MAKQKQITVRFILSGASKGDLWTSKGKFSLDSNLSQKDLEYLYNEGFTNIILKVEG